MSDYYETLGVERSATQEDIKRAYRKMAHKHHPDKDGGDEEKFKQVNEAYQTLSDENKKQQYDQFGQTFDGTGAPGGNPFGGAGGFEGFNVNMEDLGGVGDIFEQFFGGSRTRSRARQGRDISIDATVSFIESASNTNQEVSLRSYTACSHCNGNGAEPGTPIKDCATCEGKGVVNRTQQTPLGVFSQRVNCVDCQGDGKLAETPCTTCKGDGRELRNRTLTINIPAGIADGQTIRITGEGEVPERGGATGDLYVTVHVEKDQNLTREGNDIHTAADISFAEAALGTTTHIQTLKGDEEITIPAGTQPEETITLHGQGFPEIGGTATGDQIVRVKVEVPTQLSREQKDLLEKFKNAKGKKRSFFS